MATLKNLVDETTNIKNELISCHSDLKNNLINEGVEISDSDKMGDLVNKVPAITKGSFVAKERGFIFEQGICSIPNKGSAFFIDDGEGSTYLMTRSGSASSILKPYKINLSNFNIDDSIPSVSNTYYLQKQILAEPGNYQYIGSQENTKFTKVSLSDFITTALPSALYTQTNILYYKGNFYEFHNRSSTSLVVRKLDDTLTTWSVIHEGSIKSYSSNCINVFLYNDTFYIVSSLGGSKINLYSFNHLNMTLALIKENVPIKSNSRHTLREKYMTLPVGRYSEVFIANKKVVLTDGNLFSILNMETFEFDEYIVLSSYEAYNYRYQKTYGNYVFGYPLGNGSNNFSVDLITIIN